MKYDILLEEVAQKYNLYKGQQIDYDFFMKMYNEYSDKLSINEFIELLGIKYRTFIVFKSKHKNSNNTGNKKVTIKILLNTNLSKQEQIKKIILLTRKYDLYKNKKISYEFFETMYKDVKTVLTRIEFANLLGIKDSNLGNSRRTNDKMRIFKNCKLSKDIVTKIRKSIMKQYEGKKIYFESNNDNKGDIDFLELYQQYRIYFSPNEFAEILGISEKSLWYAKRHIANPIIKDIEKVDKVNSIKDELEKMAYLRKDEIDAICKRLQISRDDFITYYINKGKFFDSINYVQALDKNDGLWINKGRIKQETIEKYKEIFLRISRTVTTQIYYNEDLVESVLLFILENCRDLVGNFSYDLKLMEQMIWLRARQYARYTSFVEMKKNNAILPFNDEILSSIKQDDNISDKEIVDCSMKEENVIHILQYGLDQGYNKQEILEVLSKTFNIKETEIIDKIKEYLLKNGNVKHTENDEYEIGEY